MGLHVASRGAHDAWRPQERLGRLVGWHAVVVGAAWFPLGLAAALLVWGGYDGRAVVAWLRDGPTALSAGVLALGLVSLVPFAWPVLIGMGLYEGGLAGDIAAGEPGARGRAAVSVGFHAVCVLGVAVVATMAAGLEHVVAPAGSWAEGTYLLPAEARAALSWIWLAPMLLVLADVLLVVRLLGTPTRPPAHPSR